MSVKDYEGIRAVTVAGTTAPNSATPITAPCRLCGWSLFGGNTNSLEIQGTIVAPAAGNNVCQITGVPAGEYHMIWNVGLSGPAAAAEQDNFRVTVAGTVVANSQNLPAAGEYPQADLTIVVPAGGGTVKITAVAAGTAGVTYLASFSLSTGPIVQGQIFDSGQLLGVTAMDTGKIDTQWLTDGGIYVSSQLAVTVLAGTISGVLYIRDYLDSPPGHEST